MTSPSPSTPFFGREHELSRLAELAAKKSASLVVIKGRRRIGKSRLTDEFARRLPGYTSLHYVCEIKFSRNAAPASVVAEMTQKIGRLSIPRNMSYRPVLIYAGALSPALEESTYFTAKIDFGEFLR